MKEPTSEDLERQLREFYSEVPAPPGGLVAGREGVLAEGARLRSQVLRPVVSGANEVETKIPERRRTMQSLVAYKVLAAVLAVVVAFASAGGGLALAADALPGDLLYPVKLFSEDVRFLLTRDPAERAELAMNLAAERVEEMQRLTAMGVDVPEEVVKRMSRQMEQAMAEIAEARPEEVPGLLERLRERTRVQEQLLNQAQSVAHEENQLRLRQAIEVTERVRQAAGGALDDPQQFRLEYQHRYEGGPGPSHTRTPTVTPTSMEEQQRNREENQDRWEGTSGPHGAGSPSPTDTSRATVTPSPTNEPQQNQEEYQHRHEGTPGPHQEQGGTPPEGGAESSPSANGGTQSGSSH